jgi:DNA invertase Pin-like site-specific DNA recombinase
MLLSFAQFEREVTSERIRDKIAASKRKGLWVGGPLPLGYDMKDGKIAVVESEAEQVRLIFRRYLELSGVNALVRDLKERNIRTKTRLLATGDIRGGIAFERGTPTGMRRLLSARTPNPVIRDQSLKRDWMRLNRHRALGF